MASVWLFSLLAIFSLSGISTAANDTYVENNYVSVINTVVSVIRNRQEIIKSAGTFNTSQLTNIGSLFSLENLLQLAEDVSSLLKQPRDLFGEFADVPNFNFTAGDATEIPANSTKSTGQNVFTSFIKNLVTRVLQGQSTSAQGNGNIFASLISLLTRQSSGTNSETGSEALASELIAVAQPLIQNTGIADQMFGPVLTNVLTTLAENPSILGLGNTPEFNSSICNVNNSSPAGQNNITGNINMDNSTLTAQNLSAICSPNSQTNQQPSPIASILQAAASLSQHLEYLPVQCRSDFSTMVSGLVNSEGWALSSTY